MSTAMTLKAAAAELGLSVSSLRRDIDLGAPVARRGSRGRGKATLLDPKVIEAWRLAQGPCMAQARAAAAAELAGELPEILAGAVAEVFRQIEGPHKRAMAGALAACWYRASCGVLDYLRRDNPAIPEIRQLPEQIERLRKIAAR